MHIVARPYRSPVRRSTCATVVKSGPRSSARVQAGRFMHLPPAPSRSWAVPSKAITLPLEVPMLAARMPWLVAVLFVTLATTAAAPVRTGPATGRIAGHVRDGQGAPIAHAQVFVVGTALSAITDTSGAFLLPAVPAGTVTVRAARTGYAFAETGGTRAGGRDADTQFHPGERPRCEATRRVQRRRAVRRPRPFLR